MRKSLYVGLGLFLGYVIGHIVGNGKKELSKIPENEPNYASTLQVSRIEDSKRILYKLEVLRCVTPNGVINLLPGEYLDENRNLILEPTYWVIDVGQYSYLARNVTNP
jgi:hypothetical protein